MKNTEKGRGLFFLTIKDDSKKRQIPISILALNLR